MAKIIKKRKNIAAFFNRDIQWLRKNMPELRACGAVFYMREGRPPRKILCAFDTVLMAWASEKGCQGEIV